MNFNQYFKHRKILRLVAVISTLSLIILCLGWELKWAPIRPEGSWWVLKVLPLIILLPGLLKSRLYSFQWGSMAVLLYLMEGLVRATSDALLFSRQLAWAAVFLSTVLFCSLIFYTHTFKRKK
jgi:uncharacterized membrane protein